MQISAPGEVGEFIALLFKQDPGGLAAFSRWMELNAFAGQAQATYGQRHEEAQAVIQDIRL